MNFINKPDSEWTDDDHATKQAWDAFGADDERKSICKACGDYWYEIHYKNGYCFSCQQKGLHSEKRLDWFLIFIYYIMFFMFIVFLIYICTS